MSRKIKNSNRTNISEERQKKLKKENRHLILFTVILGAVIVIGTLGVLIYRSGWIKNSMSAIKIEGTGYKLCEFNYYYYAYYNAYLDENSQYLDYMFDQSESLKTQDYSDEQTWFEYFSDGAKESMISVVQAAEEAQDAGFELSDSAKTEIDATMKSIEDAADTAGTTVDKYLSNIYGNGMTETLYQKHLEYSYIASEYGDYLKEQYVFSDEDINAYYEKNQAQYTFVNYERFYVKASEVDTEPSKEEKEAAYEIAKQILEKVKTGTDLKTASQEFADSGTYYSFEDAYYDKSFSYGDWLFSTDRKDGDHEIIDDGSGYYVMVFHERNSGDYHAANILDLSFPVDVSTVDAQEDSSEDQKNQLYEDSCTKAEEAQKKWEDSDKSSDAAEKIASEYEDESQEDGIFKNLVRNTLDSTVDSWVFDSSRKAGDSTVLYTESGFHFLVYESEGIEAWTVEAEDDLRNQTYDDWYQNLIDSAKVSENSYVLEFAGGEN